MHVHVHVHVQNAVAQSQDALQAGSRPELPFDTLAEIVGNAAVSDPLTLLQRQGQAKKLAKNVSPKPLAFPR